MTAVEYLYRIYNYNGCLEINIIYHDYNKHKCKKLTNHDSSCVTVITGEHKVSICSRAHHKNGVAH